MTAQILLILAQTLTFIHGVDKDCEIAVSIRTNETPALTRRNIGLVRKIQDKVASEHPDRKVIALHCIIHHESLCKSVLNVKDIVKLIVKAVNYIHSKGLNHHQFLSFLI